MRVLRFGSVLALLGAVCGWSPTALAGEPTCDTFINTIPYTISAQGHYCLSSNVATAITTGAAITIDANSVVLDLRGYKIGGQAAGLATQAVGVLVNIHSTVVIRNGLIRGFYSGIHFAAGMTSENNNNIVEDINADSNTRFGILVDGGTNNTVRNSTVGNTGGSTIDTSDSAGIAIYSTNSFATNNTVTGTTPAVGGVGYFGVIFYGATGRAVNNQVIGNGMTMDVNNQCFVFTTGTLYKDNTASECGASYAGTGTAVGTTNYP